LFKIIYSQHKVSLGMLYFTPSFVQELSLHALSFHAPQNQNIPLQQRLTNLTN